MREKLICIMLVSSMTGCAAEQADPTPPLPTARPNILVIMTDDQTVESMRVMSLTRQLIGASGATFTNSVVTYALCCPSRATFLTGQYPHNHRVLNNVPPEGGHARLDHANTLPVWLQDAGYVTGHIGKYLNGYGSVDTLEVPPGWTEWYAAIGRTGEDYYEYVLNENGAVVPYGSAPEEYQTDLYTEKAADFIRRHAADAAPGMRPFFLFIGYGAPHAGTPAEPGDPPLGTPVPAARHKGRFAGEKLPVTPRFNESDMGDKPSSMRERAALTDRQALQIKEVYRQRLESLLAVDEGVARIIESLRRAKVLESSLIIYTSDNGFFHGEHRIAFDKALPYGPAVKVPLLMRGPGVDPGSTVSAPVANIDLAATIVEMARAKPGRTMDGRSLAPFLSGGVTSWPGGNAARHLLVEDSRLGSPSTRFWSVRQGVYVYTEYDNGDHELYDLRVDSAEIRSRHAHPDYAPVRQRLAKRLAAMKDCRGPTACW